jgi:DNA repair protein RadC
VIRLNGDIRKLLALTLREKEESITVNELVAKYECPRDLYNATVEELATIKGIGPAKAKQIKAIVELGIRLASMRGEARPVIKSPADVADLLMPEMRYLDREHFRVMLLNTKHHVFGVETISVGNLNSSLVHPRELFRNAIKRGAAAVVLVHNHPSGDPSPSTEDTEITRRLVEVGNLIGIQVLDHVIIGEGNYVSLREQGVI